MTESPLSMTRLGLFQGILPISRQEIWKDVLAGMTLAALGIPEAMGYTKIALTPVVTGLYTLLVPVVVFAILGSSRHIVVAADSATAAILAGGLVHYAAAYSAEYVALAGLLALLCAGLLIVARLFRLGFLADFLSRSALLGFLTGVGIQVAVGELSPMLGIAKHEHSTVPLLWETLRHLDHIQLATALVSASVLLVIVVSGRLAPRFPGALIAVVGAILASMFLGLQQLGVASVGSVPQGLPHFQLPDVHWATAASLLVTAASCTIVIIAQSAATSRSYALRYNDAFNQNRDLIGLAAANIGAAVSGTFVVNGSPTKTEMVDMAGGRSQVSQLTMSLVVLLVLLFLARPLSFMPAAVLSAVVFLIGVRLIDVAGFRELYRKRRDEFWIATLTAMAVAFIGVEQGILLAVVFSIVDHLRVSYRPPTRLLTFSKGGELLPVAVSTREAALPGCMIYRFEAPLYYANSEFFKTEVLGLLHSAATPVRWFVVRFDSISDVDFTAAKMLLQLIKLLKRQNVTLVLSDVGPGMRNLLERYEIAAELGSGKIFESISLTLRDYSKNAA